MAYKISIVIPTFNRRDTLRTTLLSFCRQSYTDFELVVADDGSSDGTAELVRSLTLPFAVQYCRQENAGRSAARNLGYKAAGGEIILFVDDHMIADSKLIEEHLAYHEKYRALNLAAVRGRMIFIDEPGQAPLVPKPLPRLTSWEQQLNEQDPLKFHTGNVSITKLALEKLSGFDEKIKEYGFEDQELGYRLKKAGYRIKYSERAVAYIVRVSFDPAIDYSKARQAGHCAVLCYRKDKWFGWRAGANPFNLFLYYLLSFNNNWWLRRAQAVKSHDRIKFFYFLLGVWEGFNPKSAVAMGPKPALKK